MAALVVLHSATAYAAGDEWTAVKVRGTVIHLVGSQWEEFSRGDTIADGQAVRTLQSGRLQLQRDQGSISLAPNTVVEIDENQQGDFTTVRQYSGSVTIEARQGDIAHIAVETPELLVSTAAGVISVAFDGNTAKVEVDSGSVAVIDRIHGTKSVLVAGQAVTRSASAGMDFSGSGTSPASVDASGDVVAASVDANSKAPSPSKDSGSTGGSADAAGAESGSADDNASGVNSGDSGASKSGDNGNGNNGNGNNGASNPGNSGNGNSGDNGIGSGNANNGYKGNGG